MCVFIDVDIYIRTHFDGFLLIFNEKGQPKYMYFWIMLYSYSNFMIFFFFLGIISLEVERLKPCLGYVVCKEISLSIYYIHTLSNKKSRKNHKKFGSPLLLLIN